MDTAEKYGLTAAQMQQRVDVIRSLSPAPGSVLSQPEETVYLLPDVLLEKTDTDVLSRSDTEKLFAHLKCDEGYPLEIHDSMDHLVFGYITKDAADSLKWEFNSLKKSVCRILTMRDVQLGLINETEDHIYRHKGLKIWLGR